MVVMEDISSEYQSADFDRHLLVSLSDQIKSKITLFHQAHFVHGDLRDTNVMVRKDREPGFLLVDFDWAGKIEEVRYPINVNQMDFYRPVGASDGEDIWQSMM